MYSPFNETYHGLDTEDVAVVTLAGVVLGDVGEVCKVLRVLTRAVDVAYLVLTDQLLQHVDTINTYCDKTTFTAGV